MLSTSAPTHLHTSPPSTLLSQLENASPPGSEGRMHRYSWVTHVSFQNSCFSGSFRRAHAQLSCWAMHGLFTACRRNPLTSCEGCVCIMSWRHMASLCHASHGYRVPLVYPWGRPIGLHCNSPNWQAFMNNQFIQRTTYKYHQISWSWLFLVAFPAVSNGKASSPRNF